jgi:hypothetical protein
VQIHITSHLENNQPDRLCLILDRRLTDAIQGILEAIDTIAAGEAEGEILPERSGESICAALADALEFLRDLRDGGKRA